MFRRRAETPQNNEIFVLLVRHQFLELFWLCNLLQMVRGGWDINIKIWYDNVNLNVCYSELGFHFHRFWLSIFANNKKEQFRQLVHRKFFNRFIEAKFLKLGLCVNCYVKNSTDVTRHTPTGLRHRWIYHARLVHLKQDASTFGYQLYDFNEVLKLPSSGLSSQLVTSQRCFLPFLFFRAFVSSFSSKNKIND